MRKFGIMLIIGVLGFIISDCGIGQGIRNYYPLKEGMAWKYQLTVESTLLFGMDYTTTQDVINFPERKLQDEWVTPQKVTVKDAQDKGRTYFEFIGVDNEGIYLYAEQLLNQSEPKIRKGRYYFIKTPLEIGNCWEYEGDDYKSTSTIIDRETVTISAGNFENCLKIEEKGVKEENGRRVEFEYVDWYASGMGIIKFFQKEHTLPGERKDYPQDWKDLKSWWDMFSNLFTGMGIPTELKIQGELISYTESTRPTIHTSNGKSTLLIVLILLFAGIISGVSILYLKGKDASKNKVTELLLDEKKPDDPLSW